MSFAKPAVLRLRLPLGSYGFKGGVNIGEAVNLTNDLAVLDFVGVGDTPVDRDVAASAGRPPLRVADNPRIGVDVLVNFDRPIIEERHPALQAGKDPRLSPDDLGDIGGC